MRHDVVVLTNDLRHPGEVGSVKDGVNEASPTHAGEQPLHHPEGAVAGRSRDTPAGSSSKGFVRAAGT